MEKHHREPIKHTCPDIDKYIKSIKYEIIKDRDLRNMDEKELFNSASSMSSGFLLIFFVFLRYFLQER
jgi:hypothetical protein